jgi:hypothetical protein
MINLKACPRCGGDTSPEEILGELEIVCLQCGHRSYPQTSHPDWRGSSRRAGLGVQRRAA